MTLPDKISMDDPLAASLWSIARQVERNDRIATHTPHQLAWLDLDEWEPMIADVAGNGPPDPIQSAIAALVVAMRSATNRHGRCVGGVAHYYVSTYCQHALDDPLLRDETAELHAMCRRRCKVCGAPCRCPSCRHVEAVPDMLLGIPSLAGVFVPLIEVIRIAEPLAVTPPDVLAYVWRHHDGTEDVIRPNEIAVLRPAPVE